MVLQALEGLSNRQSAIPPIVAGAYNGATAR
jgi:hypothetical protein